MILPTHIVAAGGLVFNDKNEILLVKNPRKGWEFPGGMVDPGETVPQALLREIQEESGVIAKIENMVGIYSNTKKKKGYNGVKEIPTIVSIDFICSYVSGDLKTSSESLDVKWASIETALNMVNHKQQFRLKRALDFKSSIYSVGFEVDSNNEIAIKEEYVFKR